jgi:hypothetical protein
MHVLIKSAQNVHYLRKACRAWDRPMLCSTKKVTSIADESLGPLS